MARIVRTPRLLEVSRWKPGAVNLFPPILLAHGTLGAWDELIFLSVFVIFLIIMGVAWARSRAIGDDDLEDTAEPPANPSATPESDDRFALK